MRSLLKDFFAVFAAGIIFAASAWLFYNDINTTLKNVGGEEIGVVVFKKNTAQRKYTGRAVWENIDSAMTLFNYDTIRTSTDSEAVILMNDGTEIVLQDNTLIVLEWGETAKNIDFLGGIISAKNLSADASAVQIKASDTTISLADASIKMEQDKDGRLGLSVSEGNIGLSRGGLTQDIGANQRAFFESGMENFSIDDMAVKPLMPEDNSYFITFSNERNIIFTWETAVTANALPPDLALQISRDIDFTRVTAEYLSAGETTYLETFQEGTYYWRFVSGENNEPESTPRRFVVINDIMPKPVTPAPDTLIKYRNLLPGVRFFWQQGFYADHYLLEIASNRAFTDKKSEIIRGSFFNIDTLDEGIYYWRVSPHYSVGGIGYPATGETQTFRIEKNIILSPLTLMFPPDKSEIRTIEAAKGITFKWREERELSGYHFYFSDNPAFTTFIYNEPVNSAGYSIDEPPEPGTYYWKAGGVTTDNEMLPHSETRTLIIKETSGEIALLNPSKDESFELPPLGSRTFNWESSVGDTFRFTLYKESLNSPPIIDDIVKGKSRKVLIPASGTYFWQVSLLDDRNNEVISSPISGFSTRVPLDAPQLRLPSEGQEVKIIGEDSLEISWDRNFEADYYSVNLVNQSKGISVFNNLETDSNSIVTDEVKKTGEGSYNIKIKAYKNASAGWSAQESPEAERNFIISEIISYDAPEPVYPGDNSIINREDILAGKLTFRWNHRPLLPRYEINISDSVTFNRNLSVYSVTGNSYTLTDIKPGRYFWRVKGYDASGYETPVSSVNSLTIEDLWPLPVPAIVSPERNEQINMDFRDSILFKWQPVPEADYYSVSFTRTGFLQPLYMNEKFRRTEFDFNDLEKLDVGDFRLEVQAFKDTAGIEKRSSPPAYTDFKILLSQPETVEIEIIISD